MGSLLPGWDERSPGIAPKGFEDAPDEDEEMGYFAAYAKLKKLQKEQGAEPASPMPISRRSSMPLSRHSPLGDARGSPTALLVPGTPTGRSLSRADTGAGSGSFGSFRLQRMSSLPVTAGEKFDVLAPRTPKAPKTPRSPATPLGAGGSPRSPSLDGYKTQRDKGPDYQWWRHFDSAALNEPADVASGKDSSYAPQFKVTGQRMAAYRVHTVEEEPSPPIQAH